MRAASLGGRAAIAGCEIFLSRSPSPLAPLSLSRSVARQRQAAAGLTSAFPFRASAVHGGNGSSRPASRSLLHGCRALLRNSFLVVEELRSHLAWIKDLFTQKIFELVLKEMKSSHWWRALISCN